MDEVSGVAGFVLPGDSVDIIFTQDKGRNSRAVNLVSEILLNDVEVLAVDLNDNPLTEQPQVFGRATLAVTVEDAKNCPSPPGWATCHWRCAVPVSQIRPSLLQP